MLKSMKIFVLILLIVAFVFMGCGVGKNHEINQNSDVFFDNDWALTAKDIAQNRNLQDYNQGSHFYCRSRFSGSFGNDPDKLDGEKKVRDFIWQHWIEKKRGYIRISCPGTDVRNTAHYFIEPDANGEWNIVKRYIFQASDDKITRTDTVLKLTERLENKEKGYWYLVLKSSNGEFTEKLPRDY